MHRNLFFSNFEILFLERTQWFFYWEIKSCKCLKKKIQTKYKHSNKQHNKTSPPSHPQKISTYKTYRNSNISRNIYEKKWPWMRFPEYSSIIIPPPMYLQFSNHPHFLKILCLSNQHYCSRISCQKREQLFPVLNFTYLHAKYKLGKLLIIRSKVFSVLAQNSKQLIVNIICEYTQHELLCNFSCN